MWRETAHRSPATDDESLPDHWWAAAISVGVLLTVAWITTIGYGVLKLILAARTWSLQLTL